MRPAVPSPAVESARVACTCAWRRPRGNQAHSKKILLFQDLLIKVLQTLHVIMSSPAKPAGTSTISEADLPLQTIAAHLESFWGSPTIRKKTLLRQNLSLQAIAMRVGCACVRYERHLEVLHPCHLLPQSPAPWQLLVLLHVLVAPPLQRGHWDRHVLLLGEENSTSTRCSDAKNLEWI